MDHVIAESATYYGGMERISGAIVRLHGPLNLRAVDRVTMLAGITFVAFGLALLILHHDRAGPFVALLGGMVILLRSHLDRRRHDDMVWAMAAIEPDPIAALARYEYLYRLRFADLHVVAAWREGRDMLGLPPDDSDLDAPPQVRAMFEHLRMIPRETC